MRETELFFPSHDGVSTIRALLWEADDLSAIGSSTGKPRGILQIIHGMAEHIERYRDFAQYCVSLGYVVCGHDHIGHGKSVADPEDWGVMQPKGMMHMVEDVHQLRFLIQERFSTTLFDASLPYFIFGHSMGSFVLRVYLSRHAEGIAGAVISGTGHLPAFVSKAGSLFARLLSALKGPRHQSRFLHNLSDGAFSRQIKDARTPLDWLSTDAAVVESYIADPMCGFMFSASAYSALTELTGTIVKRSTVEAVPKEMPLLFIAGDDDPVGEKGEAVKRAVVLFKKTGHTKLRLILYPGKRHELLNETDKEQVYQDITEWLEQQALKIVSTT